MRSAGRAGARARTLAAATPSSTRAGGTRRTSGLLRPASTSPEPFEIVEGTEFPPTGLFVFLTDQTVDSYVEEATNPMFFETVRREDTTVGERSAVLIETTATGQGESEPGERTYGYVVAVGPEEDAFVVLATGLPGDERYDEFKDVADEAVKTAQFLER